MSPERYRRIREVLAKRQTDLTVCMENVHKPHNVSAIVRTGDAVGVHRVHAVWEERNRLKGGTAAGSQQWVRLDTHETISDAIAEMKRQGMQVLVTNLSDTAVDYREVDYTKPTGIIFGQEKYGVTDEAIANSDQDIVIPMVGMVQSLNVSVAAALVLYEAQRQRQNAGMYETQHLPEEECQRLLFEGGYPTLVRVCKRKGLPYPQIDGEGHIQASQEWWQRMQMTEAAMDEIEASAPEDDED